MSKAMEWKRTTRKQRNTLRRLLIKKKTRGHYNLDIMYLKRIGEKRNVKSMKNFFKVANVGHPKAFYQLAGMFYTGIGLEESSNGYRII